MSFLINLRAERHIAEIRNSPDRSSPGAQHAIKRLKQLGPEVIDPVIGALPDADLNTTIALVEVLSTLVTEPTFPVFKRHLISGNPRIVSGITWALTGAHNYPPFLLLEALNTPGVPKDPILGVITAQKRRFTVSELLRTAYHQPANEKAMLFRIIGDIADESSLQLLISQLSRPDPVARTHVINLLSHFEGPVVDGALTTLLWDPDKGIRVAALDALQHKTGAIDVPVVCALLADPEMEVQSRAVDLLILKANQPSTVQHLIEVLKIEPQRPRKDEKERIPTAWRFAVEVLNEIPNGLRDLLDLLKEDTDWELRGRVTRALGRSSGPRLIQTTLPMVADPDPRVRRAAVEILQHAHDNSAVDWLIEGATDPDPWVAERSLEAVADVGGKRAVPALVKLLSDSSMTLPQTLPGVVRALGRLGDSGQVDTLMPLLHHEERSVRVEAIQALANLVDGARAEELTTTLTALLDSPDPTIAKLALLSIEVIESRVEASAPVPVPVPEPVEEPQRLKGGGRRWNTLPPGHAPVPVKPPRPEPVSAPRGLDIARLQPGDMLDIRYRFIERIGRGAFGTVLLTEDTMVGEQLTLKFINQNLATDEEVMGRFVQELRYSRKITHPNVIRIYDFHIIQGSYAISMEYFPSHTLAAELVHQLPLDITRVLKLAIDICNGMEAAHDQGIVHRDLKPANVLINDEDWLKVVDFGVAAAWRESNADDNLTRPGYVIGSPKYMAPEQITGKRIDHRADVYALGVILYEMATGTPPYTGGDHMAIMYQHVNGMARPPIELNPDLPPELSELIMKAMSVDKRRRFQSMQELRAALDQYWPS